MRDWEAYVRGQLRLPSLRPERENRIVREVAAQIEDIYRDAIGRGLSEADADAQALAHITNWQQLARDVQRADRPHHQARLERVANSIEAHPTRAKGPALMTAHLLRDLRFGVRQLIKAPGFTLVAVLTLALGIGATSAIFSVVNGVLLQPLPYSNPDQLVRIHEKVPQYGRFSVAPATFLDWRDQNGVFERIAAYTNTSGTIQGPDGPERVVGAAVSWDLFELLRVQPALGTGFVAEQDQPGNSDVIVISHALWQRRFSGAADVVGRTVNLNGQSTTILGVMPEGFYYPSRTAEFWRPIAINPANATRGGHFLGVVARLKAGVALERADVEMRTISERLALQYPESSANESSEVVSLHEQVVGNIRPALLTLLAAVCVVVLIACANVANLLLVRASIREKEVAIRTALGAGRSRLITQMLAESLLLALAGGIAGVFLAWLAIPAIQTLGASSIPRVMDVAIDTTVLLFAAGASLVTGLLFGLVPALQLSNTGVHAVMKEGGRSSVGSGGKWLRNGLLVLEVALSLMLVVGSVLLLRSFAKLTNVDPGFRPDGVLAFQVSLPPTAYADAERQLGFFDNLTTRLAATPGVQQVGAVQTLPMRGGYVLSFAVVGRPPARPGEEPSANHRVVTPDYFSTLEIPIRRGRTFTHTDTATSPMVAVVDEAFVQQHFADQDPIGQRIEIGNGTDGSYEIVGVVGTVNHNGLDAESRPTMYVPLTQDVFNTMWLVARSAGDPSALTPSVRQVLSSIDPTLPAYSITPLSQVLDDSVADRRFSMLLILLFGLVALFLAAVGLYGVVAYSVSLRTREIGLRMAIGAQPGAVLRMVIGDGMKLALIGVALGALGSLAASQLVATMLFNVEPHDPVSYAATAGILLTIAALACYIPARRAMKVDPVTALSD